MDGLPFAYGHKTINFDCGPTARSTIVRMLHVAWVERHLKGFL